MACQKRTQQKSKIIMTIGQCYFMTEWMKWRLIYTNSTFPKRLWNTWNLIKYKIIFDCNTPHDIANINNISLVDLNKYIESIEKDIFDGNLELPTSFSERYLTSSSVYKITANSAYHKHYDSAHESSKYSYNAPCTLVDTPTASNIINFNRSYDERSDNNSYQHDSQSHNEHSTINPSINAIRIDTSENNANDNTIEHLMTQTPIKTMVTMTMITIMTMITMKIMKVTTNSK